MQGMMPQGAPTNPLMAALAQMAQQHPPGQQGPPGMPGPGMPPPGMPAPGMPGMMPHPGMPGMPQPGMPPGMPGQPPMGGMPMPQPGMPPMGMPQPQQGMPPDMRKSLLLTSLHMLQAWLQVTPMGPEAEHGAQILQGLEMLMAGTNGPPQGSIHGVVTMPQPPPPADDGSMVEGGMNGHLNGGIPGGQGIRHDPDVPPEGLEGEAMPPNY